MYLVEIITEDTYYTGAAVHETLEEACAFAQDMRRELSGQRDYVAVRVINLAFATRW